MIEPQYFEDHVYDKGQDDEIDEENDEISVVYGRIAYMGGHFREVLEVSRDDAQERVDDVVHERADEVGCRLAENKTDREAADAALPYESDEAFHDVHDVEKGSLLIAGRVALRGIEPRF